MSNIISSNNNIIDRHSDEPDGNVESINLVDYLNQHLINEKSFEQLATLKQSLLKERNTIKNMLATQCSSSTLSELENQCNVGIAELNQMQANRANLLKSLRQHIDHSHVDTLCKFTTLINQITRIKKYIQILLIIHLLYNKIKSFIDINNLGASLRPFINLIEIQNNLHCLKSPLITNNDDQQQPCSHLTRLIDHMISDLTTLLEKKMKDELKLSLKELNWISLSVNSKDGNSGGGGGGVTGGNDSGVDGTGGETGGKDNRIKQLQSSFSNLIILQLTTQKYPLTLPSTTTATTTTTSPTATTTITTTNTSKTIATTTTTTATATTKTTNSNSKALSSTSSNSTTNLLPTSLWAIDILLESLIKGFKYHFQTKRVTNMLAKPEWPIHHVKRLIKDHLPYLTALQNALNQRTIGYIDVVHWFISGLVNTLSSKFRDDIPLLTSGSDNKLFYHTLEELVTLSQYLLDNYQYPYPIEFNILKQSATTNKRKKRVRSESSDNDDDDYEEEEEEDDDRTKSQIELLDRQMKSPFVAVFENESIFDQWINLEITACQEYFDASAHSPDCWAPYYKEDFADIDTMKPSNSAYELISLLRMVTDRYTHLSDVSLQFQFFVQIQLNLLSKYSDELHSLVPSDSYSWARTHEYDEHQLKEISSIYNSTIYIKNVLKDWDDQLLFINIYDHMKSNHDQEMLVSNASVDSNGDDNSYSAFHSTIGVYKSIGKQMMKKIVEILFNGFKIKSNLYLKRGAFVQTKSNIFLNPNNAALLSPSAKQAKQSSLSTTTTTSSTATSDELTKQTLVDEEEQEDQRRSKNRVSISSTSPPPTTTASSLSSSGGGLLVDYEQSLDISPELTDALSTLRYQLSIIVRSICFQKINTLWRKLSAEIDQYLFNLLLNSSRLKFTHKDGLQFSKDIKTLFLLFHTFTDKPEKYMKKIYESSLILRMSNSQLGKFKEDLRHYSGTGTEEKLFNDNNIYNLNLDQLISVSSISTSFIEAVFN
ncbi:hypothetical protein PPL_06809 [Heterostelium album PN500]|uniref:Uncharacterized protein n=1 Tax=Heterostelium pallidum (strain ATCC 26659 / Pp 5 / PN500) TaxID=670386 RepID=D3BDK7_HETP5|nr:hypothetical protein PPL_06809 [Heterostelium album PN500]EFA79988.1 hypothetical protein PPL_06809 [Heterostelium album PN500]|eukprot:XP_020432108.1 hypothetical protein PPL_06809 [Heterostelium album PN500]